MGFAAVRLANVQENLLLLAVGITPLGEGINQTAPQSSPRFAAFAPLRPLAAPRFALALMPGVQQLSIFVKSFGQVPQSAHIAPDNMPRPYAGLPQTPVQSLAVDMKHRP